MYILMLLIFSLLIALSIYVYINLKKKESKNNTKNNDVEKLDEVYEECQMTEFNTKNTNLEVKPKDLVPQNPCINIIQLGVSLLFDYISDKDVKGIDLIIDKSLIDKFTLIAEQYKKEGVKRNITLWGIESIFKIPINDDEREEYFVEFSIIDFWQDRNTNEVIRNNNYNTHRVKYIIGLRKNNSSIKDKSNNKEDIFIIDKISFGKESK